MKIKSNNDRSSGAELLDALTALILRHVVLKKHEARAAALWIVHTHAFGSFPISPRLKIQSPEPGCGKTTLIDVLRHTVRNPLLTVNATVAAIFRQISDRQPTLLIDEGDTSLTSRELVTLLNAGYRRNDAEVVRVDGRHSVWAPAAFAAIRGVPSQLETRSIGINLHRKLESENIEPFPHDRLKPLHRLRRRAAKWARTNRTRLEAVRPELPEALQNRAADNWLPLLAIADTAGGDWPKLSRRAAEALSIVAASRVSEGIMLLSDIRDLFASKSMKHIWSSDLAAALAAIEGRPWSQHNGRGPMTANAIAMLLAPYGIRPGDIRKDGVVKKGYRAAQFTVAFERYLQKLAA
jgi:putative DNA primase/helicase